MKSIFITGTDTGVGKTHVAVTLIRHLNQYGLSTFGIKPIASGCEYDNNGQMISADALALQVESSIKQPYHIVNPIALAEPIAPHLAAKNAGIKLSVKDAIKKITSSIQLQADINIIEGIGGWLVPLNQNELFSDIISALNIPVILVVSVKLGCLNHAILTSNSIKHAELPFIGWVANCVEPYTNISQENIDTLINWLPVPLLGTVPHGHQSNLSRNEFKINYILERLQV